MEIMLICTIILLNSFNKIFTISPKFASRIQTPLPFTFWLSQHSHLCAVL